MPSILLLLKPDFWRLLYVMVRVTTPELVAWWF
jgi:hypothetical protein